MSAAHPIRVFLVAMVLAPVLALAQERRELALQPGEAPVTVFADRIQSLEREQLLIAEGQVEIEQGDVRLEADRVEINTETGEAVAAGRVVFFDGRDRLTGERVEYSFRTGTGIVHRGEGFAAPHFHLSGERMERFGEKAYRVTRGTFTTCEADPPAWHVRWGQATAHLDDYMWGTGASFWVWRVPLVPFIPIFAANLRKDRHTGLLTPSFGTSSTKGFSVRLPFFWAIADNQDLTLVPTYYDKRGFGLGAEYRYVRREGSRGVVQGFGLYDTEDEEPRGVIGLRHDELIRPGLVLKADLNYVSDDRFFADFGDALDARSRQRLESNLSLTQTWSTWNLLARLFAYQDLTTDQPVELQRLPEIRLNATPQPVPGVPGLLFDFGGSYNNFVRDLGSDGQRLDLNPRFSYPFSPGGFLTLTPRVGVRETVYDTKVVGTTVEDGVTVEDTEKTFVHRTLFEAGFDAETRAYRVFDVGGLLGIQRVQHIIEPRLSYTYVSDADTDDLPQFDGTDAVGGNHAVTYSLINRIKARAVGTQSQPGRVWELSRLTLSQVYSIEPPSGASDRLSPISADLIVEPVFGLRFRGSATVDPYDWRVQSATTDLVYEAADWRAAVGTRHGENGRLDFLQGTFRARIGARWGVRFATNYDVEAGTVVENRYELDFREQCWAVTVAFIDRTDEDEFHISVSLLELGHYGFGRALGF